MILSTDRPMIRRRIALRTLALATVFACVIFNQNVSAHFLWLQATTAPHANPVGAWDQSTDVELFFAEQPTPEGPQFLKAVRALTVTARGPGAVALPLRDAEESRVGRWGGRNPSAWETATVYGVMEKGGTAFRLCYAARAQMEPIAETDAEDPNQLRVRWLKRTPGTVIQVLYQGRPAPSARVKLYPESGAPYERVADENGCLNAPELGVTVRALWAQWVDKTAGVHEAKPYAETRHYATLTVPAAKTGENTSGATSGATVIPTTLTVMPDPAVNSFGGAILGEWLYVYSGHVGTTHKYSVNTTTKTFRRYHLVKGVWETLPMERDLQGVALVACAGALYRTGGMSAGNAPDDEHDLISTAEFARFDPESRTWTALPPMPKARSTHDSIAVGTKIYVVGGWNMQGGEKDSPFLEDALVWDTAVPDKGWTAIPQPFRKRALSIAAVGDRIIVLGGLNAAGAVERSVNILNTADNSWSAGPDLPNPAKTEGFGPSGYGIGEHVYYSGAGGIIYRLAAGNAKTRTEEPSRAWEAVGAWHLPRITHRLLIAPLPIASGSSDRHLLLAVGGNTRGKQTNIIEAVPMGAVGSKKD